MMNESFFDWIIYGISGLILASALFEGRTTRYPSFFFYGSLVLMFVLIIAGSLNWWFFHSKYGAVIVIFAVMSLLITRFRLVVYKLRYRKIVSDVKNHIESGFRIIMVLNESEEERNILVGMLKRAIPEHALIYTRTALGPHSGPVLNIIEGHHRKATGYLLLCEQQIPARSWLSTVENGDPNTSIAVNFHSIPEME